MCRSMSGDPQESSPRWLRVDSRTCLRRVGQCVYCGVTTDLRDEHVLPFALGGRLLLEEASCASCEAITSAFEGKVLGGFMRRARAVGGYPTRRPRKRAATECVTFQVGCDTREVALPLSAAPALLQLPLLEQPGYFSGKVEAQGVSIRGVQTLAFGAEIRHALAAQQATGITQRDNLDWTSFVRMLAKIGYTFIVGTHGLPPRESVPILPLILGQKDDGSVWVGSSDFQTEAEKAGALHVLAPVVYRRSASPEEVVVAARVKLFAASGAAGYEVVVYRGPEPAGLTET